MNKHLDVFFYYIRNFIIKFLKLSGLFKSFEWTVIKFFNKRRKLSRKYIKGNGLEIGALHTPLIVSSKHAKVTYLDRQSNADLRKHYPELKDFRFVNVDIVDDGERLAKITNESQDFVIANHFIEHCENPIVTLINHFRVLKRNGILFLAVPNKLFTFDSNRPITTIQHLWGDYKNGPMISRWNHYQEYVEYALKLKGEDKINKAKELMEQRYSIHFHVWTPESFRNLILYIKRKLGINLSILYFSTNINEFIVILEKNE